MEINLVSEFKNTSTGKLFWFSHFYDTATPINFPIPNVIAAAISPNST